MSNTDKNSISEDSKAVVVQATAVLQNILGLLGSLGRLDSVFDSIEANGPEPVGEETAEGLAKALFVIFAMAHSRGLDLPEAMVKTLEKALKTTRQEAKKTIKHAKHLSEQQLNFLMSLPNSLAEKNQMATYMIEKAEVYVERQTEVPDAPPYAICVLKDPEFWIDCDRTSMAATITARALGFTVVPRPKKAISS